MSATCRLIWGGAAVWLTATLALAEPVRVLGPDHPALSPVSREEVRQEALSGLRPEARPVWMVRYPVTVETGPAEVRPVARPAHLLPDARWDFRDDGDEWTRAAMAALASHGRPLIEEEPRDIGRWCPAYVTAGPTQRRAFWVGMMSALAKYESTWRPRAVGGGGLWYGLLQIYPDTARRYGCRARTGEALLNPALNLSCAVRIMAVTVPRDSAVAVHDGRWRGVAADWGPMTSRAKIAEMASWTSQQDYCRPVPAVMASIRPVARPAPVVLSAMDDPR